MPSLYPTRSRRIEIMAAKLEASYRRAKSDGRRTNAHLRHAARLSAIYHAALEAERAAEL